MSRSSYKGPFIDEKLMKRLNQRTIAFEKNIAEIDSLRFGFSSKEKGTVIFYRNGLVEKYPFVMSTNAYALGLDPTSQLPVALQANCKSSDEFILNFNQLCRINNFYFHFVIHGNNITTTMRETSNLININISSSFK